MKKDFECCANCRRRYKLVKFDYSHGGCIHTDMDGYVCMAFSDEKEAIWMVGNHEKLNMCECYVPTKDKTEI